MRTCLPGAIKSKRSPYTFFIWGSPTAELVATVPGKDEDGLEVGLLVGLDVGDAVGLEVGLLVGLLVGLGVGAGVGLGVGAGVGLGVVGVASSQIAR